MNTTSESKNSYKYFSHGIVAEHKRRGSNEIEVICIDQQPFQEGQLTSDIHTVSSTTTDASGLTHKDRTDTSKTVTATWIGDNSNRTTAPDVRRNEKVFVYTYSDTQRYYWDVEGRNEGMRRQEKVTYRYSSTKDETVTELDNDNSISVDIDGERSTYTITTGNDNDEKVQHTFQIDSKNGNMVLSDDLGNFIEINSASKITIHNADGSHFILEEGKIHQVSEDLIAQKSKNVTVDSTTLNYTILSQGTITVPTFTVNSSTIINLNSPLVKIGPTVTVQGGNMSIGGTVAQVDSQSLQINSATVPLSPGATLSLAQQLMPILRSLGMT